MGSSIARVKIHVVIE